MEFYSLVCKESGNLLMDVIEFENKQVVIYCHERKDIRQLISIDEIYDVMKEYPDVVELIKDGVNEDYSDIKDMLYSA